MVREEEIDFVPCPAKAWDCHPQWMITVLMGKIKGRGEEVDFPTLARTTISNGGMWQLHWGCPWCL